MTRLLFATALLYLVLIQPNHPAAMTWGALAVFPLEFPPLLAGLMLAGNRLAGRALRAVLVFGLALIALLKLADYGTFIAFNRGFNLAADLNLVAAGWMLAQSSFGSVLAWAALAFATLILAIFIFALWWAMEQWAAQPVERIRPILAVLLVTTTALAIAEIGRARGAWALPEALQAMLPGAAFTARVGLERAEQFGQTRADIRAFTADARNDPMQDAGPFFGHLGERDMVMIYVESYGRSSFDNPLYAPTHTTTLRRIQADLSAHGLAMRSGWATAPMVGGQSWLAHGSVATGLWLDTQARNRAMLASPRRTLFHYAQTAGLRTVAIKPAHTLPWPEGAFFGFDAIYNAADLGYAGLALNWVTMPDQFALRALERLELERAPRPPILAQVALISSHAPWVPVVDLVPWDDLGDGRIFDPWALAGPTPEEVWRDHDRVRDQFRQAVDYSLRTVGAWAARQADAAPLLVILGDHEPARFVSGNDGFDVPIHIIGPPDLVDRFASLGWTAGLIPDPTTSARRMDSLRDTFLTRLSSP
jgi:hypothetical protein